METYDIAVLGGGAAGLMAAVASTEAGHSGLRVLVLEGNARVGKKLLATGNGRCNLSNRHVSPEHYHGDTGRAITLLKRFPPEKVGSLSPWDCSAGSWRKAVCIPIPSRRLLCWRFYVSIWSVKG